MDMRSIMTLLEAAPQPHTLPDIIRQTVADFAKRGVALEKIGTGWCGEFAETVLDRWIGDGWQHKDGKGFYSLETDSFFRYDEHYNALGWDWEMLKTHWNIEPPASEKVMNIVMEATHVWISTGGKHYDAEAPDGVQNFFDLPFFKRWIVGIKAEVGET